jgi:ABC-type branched-subunit amino acid transport system permease subunit
MKQQLKSSLGQAPAATIASIPVKIWSRSMMIAGLIVALTLPFAVKNFLIFQLTLALIYAVAILGLNLLTGFNGQFSLGHSAFYGIGAYTAAILMDRADIAYYWTLPAAGATCFVFGFLFGLPALRLEGLYLALATFALAIATPQLLKSTPFEPWAHSTAKCNGEIFGVEENLTRSLVAEYLSGARVEFILDHLDIGI